MSNRSWRRTGAWVSLWVTAAGTVAPVAKADDAPQLRAAGSFNRSPITQAMLEAEAESRRAYLQQADSIAAQTESKVRELRSKATPSKITQAEREQAFVDVREALAFANGAYVSRRRAMDSFAEGFGQLTNILGALPGNKGGQIGMSILASAANATMIEKLDRFVGATEKYRSAVENAVQLAVLQTPLALVEKYQNQGISDGNYAEIAHELLSSSEFFKKGAADGLSADAKVEIASAQAAVLRKAVGLVVAAHNSGKAAIEKLRADTTSKFNAQKQTINLLAKDVKEFKTQISTQVDAIREMARTTQKQVEVLTASVDGLSAQQAATQQAMWRQMGPSDRLSALEDPGFLPGMKKEERDDYIKSLRTTVKVMSARDTALQGLSTAGDIGKIAAAIGLPIDIYNLDKNIATAEASVYTISAFAMGDYFGAIKGVAGIFGGGGTANPNGPEFARVNAKLDEVLKLQRATLKAIEDLSDQIARQHQDVSRKLDILDAKINYGNLILATTTVKPYADCRKFVDTAMNHYQMKNGLYASYEQRKAHFDADESSAQRLARNCGKWLDDVVETDTTLGSPAHWGGITAVSEVLLANTWETGAIGRQGSFQARHENLWDATRAILGWEFVGDDNVGRKLLNCERIGIGQMARAPQKVQDITDGVADCSTAKAIEPRIDPDTPLFRSSLSATSAPTGEFDPAAVMGYAVSPAAVHHFGEILLFMAPFWELAGRESAIGDALRLPTLKELASLKPPNFIKSTDTLRPLQWTSKYLDVVNLALAQQAVLSGAFIAPKIVEALERENFGDGRSFPTGKTIKAILAETAGFGSAADTCMVNARSWKAEPYLAAICLMQDYPWLKDNVARILAAQEVSGRVTRREYRYLLEAEDPVFATNTLRRHKTLRRIEGPSGRKWRWYVRTPDGYEWVDLPRVAEIWSGELAYPGFSYALFDLRRRLEARVVAYAAHERALSADANRRNARRRQNVEWMLRVSSMSERGLIDVPMISFAK